MILSKNTNILLIKVILILILQSFSFGNESNLKNNSFANAFATENILVIKEEKDFEEWKKKPNDKDYIIKIYKEDKVCTIKKDTYITLFRRPNDFISFYISVFGEKDSCSGIVHEAYIHDKIKDIEEFNKNNKSEYWKKYYMSLSSEEISKDLVKLFGEKLPLQIDEITILEKVYNYKEQLYFEKKFTPNKIYLNDTNINTMEEILIKSDKTNICNNLVGNIFFDKNGIAIYKWNIFDEKKLIHSFSHKVNKNNCK